MPPRRPTGLKKVPIPEPKKFDVTKPTVYKPSVKLRDAIKSSYGSKKHQDAITSEGYQRDHELSSHNQEVYYHPTNKKLLMTVAGTHNTGDWLTDSSVLFNTLKTTKRYNSANKTLTAAKQKYKPAETVLAGHSLGGSIVSQLPSSPTTKKITYNKGTSFHNIFTPPAADEIVLRTKNDPTSIFAASHPNTINLPSNTINPIRAHSSDQLENTQIAL